MTHCKVNKLSKQPCCKFLSNSGCQYCDITAILSNASTNILKIQTKRAFNLYNIFLTAKQFTNLQYFLNLSADQLKPPL